MSMFDDFYEHDREVAIFAINLVEKLGEKLAGMASAMLYTDGASSVRVPWGYDDEADPQRLLADFPDECWNPETADVVLPISLNDFARKALKDTGLLEKREDMGPRDMDRVINGLACGILNVDPAVYPFRMDREMYDFAKREACGLKLEYDSEMSQLFVEFEVGKPQAPKARQKP